MTIYHKKTARAALCIFTVLYSVSDASADLVKDCEDCSDMVFVTGGSFTMHTPYTDPDKHSSDREIVIADFYVSTKEISVSQWKVCVKDGGCFNRTAPEIAATSPDSPVVNVSWHDAKDYVAWLSAKTGKDYRLPSESEWQYAASFDGGDRFWWGEDISRKYLNYGSDTSLNLETAVLDGWKGIAPVGSFPPNPLGLYDMNGNVFEWVEDCFDASMKAMSFHHDPMKTIPQDGSPSKPLNAKKCFNRTIKGGAYDSPPLASSNLFRTGFFASEANMAANNIGFRVAKSK